MRIIFCIIFSLSLLTVQAVSAQNIDSMQHIVNTTRDNNIKVRTLLEISDYWSYRDTAKGFLYLEEANKIINDDYLKGIYYFYKGQNLFDIKPEEAKSAYMDADKYLLKYNTPEAYYFRTRAWHNYGVLEQGSGNEKVFLDILMGTSVPLAQKSGDNRLLAAQYADIGVVLYNQKEYEKAISYYTRALNAVKKESEQDFKTINKLIEIYGNLAEVYVFNLDTLKAKNTLDTLETYVKNHPSSPFTPVFYYAKGKYYQLLEQYANSLEILNQGLAVSEKFLNIHDINRMHYEKAYCLKRLERYEEAKELYYITYKNAVQLKSMKNAVIHLKELAEIENLLGNYDSAYYYSKKAFMLSDSLNREQLTIEVASMEARFNAAEKENQLINLRNKSRMQRVLMGSGIILLLLLLIFFSYAMRQRRKRSEQQFKMLEQEKELEVSRALMDGEEQERMRLARDLHDGIGGTITGIKLKLESSAEQTNNAELFKTVSQLEGAVHELRRTAKNLMPETLTKFGLEEALKDYCETMQTDKTSISFYSSNLSAITDKNKQLVIYRIIQELINNAVKHAEATEIFLQCTLQDNLLLISIEDNGKGFNLKDVKRNMGLNNIEMRVNYLEGKINIDSQPGKGTSVNIECKI